MKQVIYTNLPDDKDEFAIMQKCFDAMNLPYELQDGMHMNMQAYINNNNVFFQAKDDRERTRIALERACNALHRIIINFQLIERGTHD